MRGIAVDQFLLLQITLDPQVFQAIGTSNTCVKPVKAARADVFVKPHSSGQQATPVKQFSTAQEKPSSASFLAPQISGSISKDSPEPASTHMEQAKDKLRPAPDLHYAFLSHMLNNLSITLSFHKFHPHLLHSTNKIHLSYLPAVIHLHAAVQARPLFSRQSCPTLALPPPSSHTLSALLLPQHLHTANYLFASCNSPHSDCKNQSVSIILHLSCLFHQISLSSKALMSHSLFKGICSIIPHQD